MKWLTDFLGLLYDLVIGDCWQIAAGIALVLLAGIGLLRFDVIPISLFSSGLGAVIMIGSAFIIYVEARLG